MEQSSENKNRTNADETCEVFMNDVIMEKTREKNLTMQIEMNKNLESENK